MEQALQDILSEAEGKSESLGTMAEYESFKATLVGPQGSLTRVSKSMKDVAKEDRPRMGKLINEVKGKLEVILSNTFERIEEDEISKALGPAIDPTLPSPEASRGAVHPITQVRREIHSIFRRIGFTVAEGPEIDTEWYCFDALNTPADHPARDEQDTLYLAHGKDVSNVSKHNNERYLLRTHTSTVQIRTMLKEGEPPLRIVSPGRCFRRDRVDATHSANFHQVEGLYVDKNVTLQDLKATLDYFIHEMFGKDVKTRLRPSFFPFTEPSFELDFMAPKMGKLSGQWIEIMGCGMVDPAVFEAVNIDPVAYTGFAFGMGIERVAMLLLGVDDIRHFYNNDLRFNNQFL